MYAGSETWTSSITKPLDSHLSFFVSALIFFSKLSLCVYRELCRMTSKLKQAQQFPRWFCQRQALFWLTWQSCADVCASGQPQVSASAEVMCKLYTVEFVKDTVTSIITWSTIHQKSSKKCLAYHFSVISLLCFDNCSLDFTPFFLSRAA